MEGKINNCYCNQYTKGNKNMNEEIYEYLNNYGFTSEELKAFNKENEKLYFANLKNVKDNIEFLEAKGLKQNEIIEGLKNGKPAWLVECSCESHTQKIIRGDALRNGNVKSCGCLALKKELLKKTLKILQICVLVN